MGLLFLLALLAFPAGEILLYVAVGGALGLWPVLGSILATALLGVLVLRRRGFSALAQARAELAHGRAPLEEMLAAALLMIAALALITPGLVSDAIGLLLLLAPVRSRLVAAIRSRIALRAGGPGGPGDPGGPRDGAGPVIEGEYRDLGPPPRS